MSRSVPTPHDAFFRQLLAQPEQAQDFINTFLPPEITTLLDLDTLQTNPDTFVDPELQPHYADLLYQADLHDGQSGHLYLLFEHKSNPDRGIFLQLLRYLTRIWEKVSAPPPLPPILAIVFYHGPRRWTIPTEFHTLFDLPQGLRDYVPQFRYWLVDLSRYSDEDLKVSVILRASLLLLKYIQRDDVTDHLPKVLTLWGELSRQETGLAYIETMLRYIAEATDKVEVEVLSRLVVDAMKGADDLMPTIAEQWIKQGREEGREEGREAAMLMLEQFLQQRFELPPDHFQTELGRLDLTTLTRLGGEAFAAEQLADFEARLAEALAQLDE